MNREASRRLSLLIVSSAAFLSVIDIFIVNVALPAIRGGLNGSEADMQLAIAMYLLGYASFLITGGRLGDYFGKKKVFIAAMLLFTLTSALCGFSQTPFQLNTARFLQGMSAAFMLPQSIAYIQVLYPDHHERVRALGIYGTIAGAASVIGQFLGGVIPDMDGSIAGWRMIFLINLPPGLLAAALAARYLPRGEAGQGGRFDYAGTILLTAALMCLVYPLIRGRELHWPLWSIAALAASAPLLVLFVCYQRKQQTGQTAPLIQLKLFTYRDFNLGLCAVLFYFMVQDSYFLVNAVMLQTGLGFSSSATGLLFVLQGVGYVVASLLSIRLIGRFGKKVLQAGVWLMMLTLFLHIVLFTAGNLHRTLLYGVLFAYGMGCGSVLPSLLTLTLKSIPARHAGAASGTYGTFQQTAVALGVGITGGIFFYVLHAAGYSIAYRAATAVNIFFLAVVGVILYLLPDETPLPQVCSEK